MLLSDLRSRIEKPASCAGNTLIHECRSFPCESGVGTAEIPKEDQLDGERGERRDHVLALLGEVYRHDVRA